MKTFNEILKDIEATRKAIDKSENNEKRLEAEWTSILDMKERHEKRKALEAEWSVAGQETKDLYLSLYLLKNNARIALFNDVMPVLLEVLEKYKGKPYGEKTRDKISKEVEEKAGARAYIGTRYNQEEISVYPSSGYGNDYSITIGTKYINGKQDRILIDNKIPDKLYRFIDAKNGKTALKRFRMGLMSSGCYEIHKENNEWILSSSYGSYFKAVERWIVTE